MGTTTAPQLGLAKHSLANTPQVGLAGPAPVQSLEGAVIMIDDAIIGASEAADVASRLALMSNCRESLGFRYYVDSIIYRIYQCTPSSRPGYATCGINNRMANLVRVLTF